MVKRKDWARLNICFNSISYKRLSQAATSIQETGKFQDPAISMLLKRMDCVANHVPQSYARMQSMRLHMRGLFVSEGMPAFWITLNPSDLKSPLVLVLAGIEQTFDTTTEGMVDEIGSRTQQKVATMNPVAVAQFFDRVIKGVFDILFQANDSNQLGALGDVSNYFGVVETNGRGMLHAHFLLWLTGNVDFLSLRDRLLSDKEFANRMILYISSVISCSVDDAVCDNSLAARCLPPSAKASDQTDEQFCKNIKADGDAVASKRQIHSKSHTSTCFKYGKKTTKKGCRFLFPRPLVPETHVDRLGVIQIERNNEWITPYNHLIASQIRSNHDISFIPTVSKALTAVYYMTNYATKHDVSQYQQILAASIVQKSIEDAQAATSPSDREKRLRNIPEERLGMVAFNKLASEREISGPQAASCLIGLPDCYTRPTSLRYINLNQVRKIFHEVISGNFTTLRGDHDKARFTSSLEAPGNVFENYCWRGTAFSSWSLYEYTKLVSIRPAKSQNSTDFPFHSSHARFKDLVQRYNPKQRATEVLVTFTGKLTEGQLEEDKIRGGHIDTVAISNDMAVIFLILLVPWQCLQTQYQHWISAETHHDWNPPYSDLWNSVIESIPSHLQDVAKNFAMLRKSYVDARVDAMLRKEAERAAWSGNNEVNEDLEDYSVPETYDDDAETSNQKLQYNPFDLEALSLAVSIIRDNWDKLDQLAAADVPSLKASTLEIVTMEDTIAMTAEGLNVHGIDSVSLDVCATENHILEEWQHQFDVSAKMGEDCLDRDREVDFGESDWDSINDEVFGERQVPERCEPSEQELRSIFPILTSLSSITSKSLKESIYRAGNNPCGKLITQIIEEYLPLNYKQRLLVEHVLHHAIQHKGCHTVGAESQLLLYVAGEGGVGKSRVIKAIELGYTILQRSNEVMLTASTGAAADGIDGHTIHSAISLNRKDTNRTGSIGTRCRFLWKGKSILIVDEISMVSMALLHSINEQCNKIRGTDRDSASFFGGLPIVVFLGDFHQFAPIGGKPLWQAPQKNDQIETMAQYIWHRFKNVIILDEQMRQQADQDYMKLVRRARDGTMTEQDAVALNSTVVYNLDQSDPLTCIAITRQNSRRQNINRKQLFRFAKERGQDIYIFPASHTRAETVSSGMIPLDKLLESQDGENDAKGPGLFLYTKDMPVMVLQNICTKWGLVNGAKGVATGVVVEPQGKFN
jgi:hypothetical protein